MLSSIGYSCLLPPPWEHFFDVSSRARHCLGFSLTSLAVSIHSPLLVLRLHDISILDTSGPALGTSCFLSTLVSPIPFIHICVHGLHPSLRTPTCVLSFFLNFPPGGLVSLPNMVWLPPNSWHFTLHLLSLPQISFLMDSLH